MSVSDSSETPDPKVISPFAETETTVSSRRKKKGVTLWIVIGLLVLVIGGVGGFILVSWLNDPLRTLEPFSVSKYLDGYRSLQGSHFKADLTVENDLGYKDGVGRLMVFSTKESAHPFVVMIPPNLASIYFTKGQHYLAELEVKEGGLIYANSCKKN